MKDGTYLQQQKLKAKFHITKNASAQNPLSRKKKKKRKRERRLRTQEKHQIDQLAMA
jgi:hypothetical protein